MKGVLLFCALMTASLGASPRDDQMGWPSPLEVYNLQQSLQGDLYLPKTPEYVEGGEMKNTRFNSDFGIVVLVESAEDVREVILFCKKYGVRPTVKSSGHDYIGRSAGNHTVSINLKRLKRIEVQNDQRSDTGVSAIVEPGNSWADVYQNLHEAGYLIVGGSAHSVSPGGYTLGGGHSPMSRMYGLAVDNVIEFTIVTPDGSIITLTRNGGTIIKPGTTQSERFEDPDLFWSVLGGGGGTYGVITSYTYRIHTPPAGGFCRFIALYPISYGGVKVSRQVFTYFSELLLNNLTANWGGYVVFSPHDALEDPDNPQSNRILGLLTFTLLHVGSCEKARPQVDALMAMQPQYRGHASTVNYTTFWDYEKTVNDPTGFRVYVVSRFVQPEDLQNPTRLSEVMSDYIDAEAPIGCTWTLLGGKVSTNPRSLSSVSPAFRTSMGSFSCGTGWEKASEDAQHIKAMRGYGDKMYTIGEGIFISEPDEDNDNWKEEYWGPGENYDRLLRTKQKYDPDQMFWCHHCVGSDLERPENARRYDTNLGSRSLPGVLTLIITLSSVTVITCMYITIDWHYN